MNWPSYSESCRQEIIKALQGPLVSGYRSNKQWGVGPRESSNIYAFERALEKAWNVKHCVAMNSGTMALTAAIKALNLPKGSEILTTPYSFSASPASILLAGHTPRFADVSPDHFCLDPESIKNSITRKTKALLVVNLFGYVPDYAEYRKFGLPIIEDACQSQGAIRDGKRIHGDIAIGSGNGQKNLPVIEGGWAYTNNAKYADRMRHYISHGENFGDTEVGVNGRMHELVAILARHGLKDLDARNQRRRDLANIVLGELSHGYSHDEEHVFYCSAFTVSEHRKRFIQRMKKRGFTIGAGYIQPTLDRYRAFRKYVTHDLPVAHELSSKTLCLIYDLTPDKPLSYARAYGKAIQECLS